MVIHDPAERRSPTAAATSTRFGGRALLSSRASWTRSGTASRRPAPRAQRAKRIRHRSAPRQAANMLVERCQLVRDDEQAVGLADPLLVTCLRAPPDLGELIVPSVAGAICVLRRADWPDAARRRVVRSAGLTEPGRTRPVEVRRVTTCSRRAGSADTRRPFHVHQVHFGRFSRRHAPYTRIAFACRDFVPAR